MVCGGVWCLVMCGGGVVVVWWCLEVCSDVWWCVVSGGV